MNKEDLKLYIDKNELHDYLYILNLTSQYSQNWPNELAIEYLRIKERLEERIKMFEKLDINSLAWFPIETEEK